MSDLDGVECSCELQERGRSLPVGHTALPLIPPWEDPEVDVAEGLTGLLALVEADVEVGLAGVPGDAVEEIGQVHLPHGRELGDVGDVLPGDDQEAPGNGLVPGLNQVAVLGLVDDVDLAVVRAKWAVRIRGHMPLLAHNIRAFRIIVIITFFMIYSIHKVLSSSTKGHQDFKKNLPL